MIAKGGMVIIIASLAIFLLFFIFWLISRSSVLLLIVWITGLLVLFNMFFFRDPDRLTPDNPLAIISAADGKVIEIVEEVEPNYFQDRVWRISIFLSIFNVHVNRIPITGKVNYLAYRSGKYIAAFKERASLENAQSMIGIVRDDGSAVMFKQIAGIIARRIVCNLTEGQLVTAGQRMGLIRYGSRVDMFVPLSAKVLVNSGQKVYGGETVIAIFAKESEELLEHSRIDQILEPEGI